MADGLNMNNSENIASIISSDNFVNLEPDIQNKIIDTVHNDKEKDGGMMGKFLGSKSTNASIHTALIICILLFILLLVDAIHSYCIGEKINMDLVNIIIPTLSLSLGYIFGKGNSN